MLVSESCGAYDLLYTYDANGNLSGIMKVASDGTTEKYAVQCNMFGDVIALYNSSKQLVAKYTYDTWGKLLSITDANGADITNTAGIWTQNSIRYRGYIYDTESGFYYLQSRYYDPETGRFINADDASLLFSTPTGLTDKNLFAYCDCNPIIREDTQGAYWNVVVGAVVGGTVSLVSSVISTVIEGDYSLKAVGKIAISTAIGAAEGAAIAFCPAAAVAISAVASAADTAIIGAIDGDSVGTIAVNSLISGSLGAIAGAGGSAFRKGGKLLNNAADAIEKVYRKGVNPIVKKSAKKVLKKALKSVGRTYVSSQIETFAFDGIYSFSSFFANELLQNRRGR